MIEFYRLARQELRQALAWYRGKSAQAAERFYLQVVRTMERISHDPASFPKSGRDKHYLRISQFPFMLVFQIRPDDVAFVLAVAHTSRRQHYWRNRNLAD